MKKKKQENKYKLHEPRIRKDFEVVESLSVLLDNKFQIPGTSFRFGLDPVINLVPYLGNLIGFGISTLLVMMMTRYGVSPKVVIKMLLNVALDALIGAIPILGKFGDFFYKANQKNYALLRAHYLEGKHNGSGIGIIITIFSVFFLVFFLIIYLLYRFLVWTYDLFSALF